MPNKPFDETRASIRSSANYLSVLFLMKGITNCLLSEFKNELPKSEMQASQNAKEQRVGESNTTRMGLYMITLRIKVERSNTKAWPSGCAWGLMETTKHKYGPKDMIFKAEAKMNLMALESNNGQDSENVGSEIPAIEVAHRYHF